MSERFLPRCPTSLSQIFCFEGPQGISRSQSFLHRHQIEDSTVLTSVKQLNYAIILCNDLETMKAFYRDLFPFPVDSESETGLTFWAGDVLLSLRKRTRYYDGNGARPELPGVQLAFLVSPAEVDLCYNQLVAKGVKILEPPTDQPRGHRTVYFADPEGNMLEVYAKI